MASWLLTSIPGPRVVCKNRQRMIVSGAVCAPCTYWFMQEQIKVPSSIDYIHTDTHIHKGALMKKIRKTTQANYGYNKLGSCKWSWRQSAAGVGREERFSFFNTCLVPPPKCRTGEVFFLGRRESYKTDEIFCIDQDRGSRFFSHSVAGWPARSLGTRRKTIDLVYIDDNKDLAGQAGHLLPRGRGRIKVMEYGDTISSRERRAGRRVKVLPLLLTEECCRWVETDQSYNGRTHCPSCA